MGDHQSDYNHGTAASWSVPVAEATYVVRTLGESALVDALSIKDGAPMATYRTGQIFYTPVDIQTTKLQRGQRPFAAWLYTGVDFESSELDPDPSRRSDRRSSVGFRIGTVGPSALGKQVHTEWHDFFEMAHPGGWEHQIKDEPGLLLTADRDWRFDFRELSNSGEWQLDTALNTGASLGNIRTEARLGGRIRLGNSLDRSWSSLSAVGLTLPKSGIDWEFFVNAESHLVAQDIFLDGNTFKSSHSVEKNPLVSEIGIGVTAKLPWFSVTIGHFLRSEEFELQDGPTPIWTLDLRSL
jgi:lipid A 3-O-deacylase